MKSVFFNPIVFCFLIVTTTNLSISLAEPTSDKEVLPTPKSPLKELGESTTPIQIKKPRFEIKTFLESPDHSFLFSVGEGRSSLNAPEKRLEFHPANYMEIGVQVTWHPFSISYRTAIEGTKSLIYNDDNIGNTHYNDFRLQYDFEFITLEAFYQKFDGFFVDLNASSGFTIQNNENKTNLLPAQKSSQIWTRSDISTYNYGLRSLMTIPIFDTKKPAIISSGKPNPLAVFGILGVGYHRLAIEGEAPLIPKIQNESFGIDRNIKGIYQHALRGVFGAGMKVYVTEHFSPYFSGAVGEELMIQSIEFEDKLESEGSTGDSAEFELGMIYDKSNYHLNFSWKLELRSSRMETAHLDSTRSALLAEYAFRF